VARANQPAKYTTERCLECGAELPIALCQSAAGYYIGTICGKCGPHSRFSGYTRNHAEAEATLNAFLAEPSQLTNYFYSSHSPRTVAELCSTDPATNVVVIRRINSEERHVQ
jgi:hypothetical protein